MKLWGYSLWVWLTLGATWLANKLVGQLAWAATMNLVRWALAIFRGKVDALLLFSPIPASIFELERNLKKFLAASAVLGVLVVAASYFGRRRHAFPLT